MRLYVSEADLYPLVLGQVNAGYTCHIDRSFLSIFIPHFTDPLGLFPPEGALRSMRDLTF